MGRLSDLTKNLANMSKEDILAHVQQIRNNKYVAKPAVQKRVADEEKKEKNTGTRKVQNAVAKMSEEDKAKLIAQLKLQLGDSNNG